MLRKFLLVPLLLAFIFSCKFPTSSNMTKGILERYPYWNVKIKDFKVQGDLTLTEKEKRLAIQALALMKLTVSTPEFEEEVMKTAPLYSHNAGVYQGGIYNITSDEIHTKELDKKRVLDIVRNANFTVSYVKSTENGIFRGAMGELSYAFYGYRAYNTGHEIWASHTRWNENELGWFASSAFHEHMHNLGYTHTNSDGGVPYIVGTHLMNPLTERILKGDLKSKYAADLEELTNLYLKMYANFLQE